MRFGKNVSGLLVIVLAVNAGCQGLAQRRNTSAPPVTRRPVDTKPAPPLRIDTSPYHPLPPSPPSNVDHRPLPEPPTTPLPPTLPATEKKPETPSVAPTAPTDPLADVRRLYRLAAERYASVDGYVARMRRRETVGGKDGVEELIELKFRKQPWSVHLRWLDGKAVGREAIYVQGRHDDKLHTKLAPSDPGSFLLKRVALSPDDPRVRSNSRHRITDAGVGVLLDSLGVCLNALDQGDRRYGTLSHLPAQTRPEFRTPLEGVQQIIPAGSDASLPAGGRRTCLFDPQSHLPALITTQDETGREVEYYCYEAIEYPRNYTDTDFDPDQLWAKRR